MINQVRLYQQSQQSRAIMRPGGIQAATYQSRDPVTGDRVLQSADGGTIHAKFLANSAPENVPSLVVMDATGSARVFQRSL